MNIEGSRHFLHATLEAMENIKKIYIRKDMDS